MAFTLPGWQSAALRSLVTIIPDWHLSNTAINSSAIRGGCVFVATSTENLNGFRVSHASSTGTITNIFQADLYAVDANGHPTGSSLATATYTPTANVTVAVTFSAAYGVTSGTAYALVIKNVDGTPASNFGRLAVGAQPNGAAWRSGWCNNIGLFSADSGTTWLLTGTGAAITLTYASGEVGSLMSYGQALSDSLGVYDANRVAVLWNSPMAVKLWGIAAVFRTVTGTPTQSIVGEVSSSSASLSVSTASINAAALTNGTVAHFHWDTPYTLDANTDYYIGVRTSDLAAGDSSNYPTVRLSTPTLKPPTVGPLYDSYSSTASTPSWSTIATRTLVIGPTFEVVGGSSGPVAGNMRGGFIN